jgi:hypothetical protein
MIHYKFNKTFEERPNIELVDGFDWRFDDDHQIVGLVLYDEDMNTTTKKTMIRYIAKVLDVSTREMKNKTKKGEYICRDDGTRIYKMNPETKKKANENHYEKHGERIKKWKYFKNIEDMIITKPQKRCVEAYELNADKLNEIRNKKLSNSSEQEHETINEYFDKLLKYV